MTMLFQGVSSFFFTLATPFSLLFLLVGINALVVALPTCKNLKRTRHFVSHYLFYSPLQEPDKNVILTFTASGQHMPQFGHASPHISIQIDTRNLCNQMCIVYKNLPPKSKKWAWSR